MMVKDWEETGDPVVEWDEISDFTEFVLVPDVGVVPMYWEADLLDGFREPEWSSMIEDHYDYRLYRILWFLVVDMTDIDVRVIEITNLTNFDERLRNAEERERSNMEDFEHFYLGYLNRVFSNGKTFTSVSKFTEIDHRDLEEVESIYGLGYTIDAEDLRASLNHSSNGSVFVTVNNMGSISIMSVNSEEEARTIMSEIWQ